MFEKYYLPNFTEEMFTVYKRMAHQVPVYKLRDDAGEILDGTFYEPELQKIIKNDDCTASRRFCGREDVKE